jgi:hypothetical protein
MKMFENRPFADKVSVRLPDPISFPITESRRTPLLSVLLGWLAMVPFVIGAAAVWGLARDTLALRLTILWGGAILAFLAGVRRGLSFRSPGGPDARQIAMMLWLFLLALGALGSPWPVASLVLLVGGYGTVGVLDPPAAERHEVPLFFAHLRPLQMLVPIVCLCAIGFRPL